MKNISGICILFSTLAVAGLCGCASDSSSSQTSQPVAAQTGQTTQTAQAQPPPKPKKPKGPIENRLKIGMTMDDVKQACGNPRDTASNSDGSATWTYASGSPTYTPWGGWGAKVHYVTIVFDTSSKVKSWSTSTTDNGPVSPF
jgi:hypothetical protein